MLLLISGYGGKTGDTAGVYDWDGKRFIWQSGIAGISFMCPGEDGAFFGAGEHASHGFVYMFVPENGGYRLADTVRVDGGALCHIAYSGKHKILTGACYASGDVFSIETKPGGFGEMKSYIRQGGAEAGLTRAHCAVFGEDEDALYSANIALDRIYRYKIEDGRLRESGCQQLDKGIGPRHIRIVNGRRYVITEYSNEILSLDDDRVRVSALPEGFSGKSFCSALSFLPVNPDYGYLYAANRGADTIAVFRLDGRDGTLEKIRDCSCGGKVPRHIEIVNGMLAVANERSDEAVFFEIDAGGGLGGVKRTVPFGGASFAGELA